MTTEILLGFVDDAIVDITTEEEEDLVSVTFLRRRHRRMARLM
tara:strand:- start:219 stop:347 length:129 start_codon:yes stop_codon:yes gene_type:complete